MRRMHLLRPRLERLLPGRRRDHEPIAANAKHEAVDDRQGRREKVGKLSDHRSALISQRQMRQTLADLREGRLDRGRLMVEKLNALGLEALHDGVDGSHDGEISFRLAKLATGPGNRRVYRAAITSSGKSRSCPQRMQTWSLTATSLPHSGQRRRGSSRSLRMNSAAMIPMPGSANPTRNQIKKELPLNLPIAPVARPNTKAIATKST